MSMPGARRWWILAVLLWLIPTTLQAQTRPTTADLSGRIIDSVGGALSAASVTVTHTQTNVSRIVVTDDRGRYIVPALTPGTYRIVVKRDGFSEQTREGVTLTLGQDAVINFSLEVSTKVEAVTITAESPIVEASKTVVGNTITEAQIANLPSNGRNYVDLALLTPGVTQSAVGSGLSFSGQRGASNNVMIDGFDNNDQSLNGVRVIFSQEAIREFQVLTNSYSAEFGKAAGGTVNVVSKSGTNQFDGSLFMFYRDEALNSKEFFERYRRYDRNGDPIGDPLATEKAPFQQLQWGATLGGPIRKDKTFFFVAYERQDTEQNNFITISDAGVAALNAAGFPVENGASPVKDLFDTFLGKVDHNWKPEHTFTARGQYAEFSDEGGFGGNAARSAGTLTLKKDWSFSASQTDILSPRLINEARLMYARQDYDIFALDPTCVGGPGRGCDGLVEGTPLVTIVGVASAGTTLHPQPRLNSRIQFVDAMSYFTRDHTLKAGLEYDGVKNIANTLPIFFKGSVVFLSLAAFQAGTPFTFTQAFGDPTGNYPLDDLSFFAQDDWRVNSQLTLKGGVRYQRQFWPNLEYTVSTPGNGRYNYTVPDDKNNWSPRLAAAWDPLGDGKTSIHAAYGTFYAYNFSAVIAISDGDRPNGTGRRTLTLRGAEAATAWRSPDHRIAEPSTPFVSNSIALAPDFDTPYTHQTSVGFDRALRSDLGLSVNYLYVRGKSQTATLEYNPLIPPTPNVNNRRVNDTPCSTASTTCRAGNVPPGQDISPLGVPFSSAQVREYKNYGETWYQGLVISLNKRLSNRYQFQVSYTLADTENMADVYTTVPENHGFGRNVDDPTGLPVGFDPYYDRGPSTNLDVRHRLGLSGLWQAPWGFLLSGIVTAASGGPFTPDAGSDLNQNGLADDRARTNPADPATELRRNADERLPSTFITNLRVSKRFRLGNGTSLEGIFEVFNLFDRANFLTIEDTFGTAAYPDNPSATYGQFLSARDPRQMQLAVRVTF
jgi:hypothetical protein